MRIHRICKTVPWKYKFIFYIDSMNRSNESFADPLRFFLHNIKNDLHVKQSKTIHFFHIQLSTLFLA
jgi:hypothetical protein